MSPRWMLVLAAMCSTIAACSNGEGKKFELHLPKHPPDKFTVDILVTSSAARPQQTGNVVVIPVSQEGKAKVHSINDLAGWKKWYVVTPDGKYDRRDFTIDSKWKMASVSVGESGSKTVDCTFGLS